MVPALSIPPAVVDAASIEITSEPTGARILVNNQPMGRAPLHVTLKITPQGFCTEYTTIKARFVAEDASQVSHAVEVELDPRTKAPAALLFTAQGVQRRMK